MSLEEFVTRHQNPEASPEAKKLMEINLTDYVEALQEISEAKGAFKRDPHEHAKSRIRDMQALARDVLIKHGIEPRGAPVDER